MRRCHSAALRFRESGINEAVLKRLDAGYLETGLNVRCWLSLCVERGRIWMPDTYAQARG